MNLNIKYCPYCGEKLELISPQKENNPIRLGLSANGVEFCVKPAFRLRSYSNKTGDSRKSKIESQNASLKIMLSTHIEARYMQGVMLVFAVLQRDILIAR